MTLADAIFELRRHLGLTQTTFGEKLGVSLITVARNEAGTPVQAKHLGGLHRIALEAGRTDLAGVFRDSLRSIKGRAALQVESAMIADLLEHERRAWKEHLRQMKQSLSMVSPEHRATLLLNIPETEERIATLTDAINWHKRRHSLPVPKPPVKPAKKPARSPK